MNSKIALEFFLTQNFQTILLLKYRNKLIIYFPFQQYKPPFMLVSLVCYGIEAVVCIIVLLIMKVKVLYLTITSVAFVCLFILAVLSYTFVKQSITHIPESLTTERLSSPMYDVSNGHIETIMIKTIAWYSPFWHHSFRCFTLWRMLHIL